MKILLATSKAIPSGGGIASYNQEVVKLFNQDHDIYLLTDSDEQNVDGYRETYSTYGKKADDYNFCKRLVTKINESKYDCIINSASAFIPILVPFLSAKTISISHFVNGIHAINAGFNSEYQNKIIALSHFGKKYLNKKFNICNENLIQVIYNFVEKGHNASSSKIDQKPIRIVYPGGTSISKSIDIIQELVYKLQKSKLNFEFIWLGGTELPASKYSILGLRKTSDLFKNDPRIIITGLVSRSQSISYISSANIFLLPSRLEGCPMTLLEAMRAGCIPIVSDAKHGSYEIITKTKAGIIVKQGSSKKLFDTISDIITHHSQYLEYYEKTYNAINNYLSQEAWRLKMKEILTDISNQKKKYIPFSIEQLKEFHHRYSTLQKKERYKDIIRSVIFRIKLDISYLINNSLIKFK